MARRKKNDDGFDTLVAAPPGLSFIIGIVVLVFIQGIPCSAGFRTLLYFIPGVIFFASFISLMKGLSKSLLHNRTKTLEDVRNMSWRDFETFVGEVFRRQGYSVQETGGGGADGGIDLILRRGREKVLVQCKQWRTYQVGVKIVREMYGLMMALRADRVIIVSVGSYTKDAADFARGKPIELIDGDKLLKLRNEQDEIERECTPDRLRECTKVIEDHVRWSKGEQESGRSKPCAVKPAGQSQKIPSCPRCNTLMILRTAKKGANAGKQFWGCARYPECKGIVNV